MTVATDSNGNKYQVYNGSSSLQVASSAAVDAVFASDHTVFVLYKGDPSSAQTFLAKGTTNTHGLNGSGRATAGYCSRWTYPVTSSVPWSYAFSYNASNADEASCVLYSNGSRCYSTGDTLSAPGAGSPLVIGQSLTGDVVAVLVASRVLLPFEVMATHDALAAPLASPVATPPTLNGVSYAPLVDGDSISDDFQDVAPALPLWEQVAGQLGVSVYSIINNSQIGHPTPYIVNDYPYLTGPEVAYVLSRGVTPLAFLYELTNDIGINSAADCLAHYQAYQALLPGGVKFACSNMTMTNRGGISVGTINTVNGLVNAWAASEGFPYADMGGDAHVGTSDIANITTYFPDGTHPNAAGVTYMAPLLTTAVLQAVASFSVASPSRVAPSSTGNTVTLAGVNTNWSVSNPTVTASAGTVTAQTVNSNSSITLTYAVPSSAQTVTFTDPASTKTATLSCSAAPHVKKWFPGLGRKVYR